MNIDSAYQNALDFTRDHYENFPVASFLIPKELRKDVTIIYWFARTADDYADEGSFTQEQRLEKLNNFEARLTSLLSGNITNEFELALYETIQKKNLSSEHFYNLLKAFKQDVIKKRYCNFAELEEYCTYSANPVGRLILELFNIRDSQAFDYSDNICTALQLTNFYQDVKTDYEKGRIYFPADEMENFGVEENIFQVGENSLNFKRLVEYNIDRTKTLFNRGKNLLRFLNGRLKIEIKWTILGGEAIIKKVEKIDYDVIRRRPKLTKKDFLLLFIRSII